MTEYDTMHVMGPGPDGPRCDFCPSEDPVMWAYPCRDVAMKTEHAEAVVLQSDGSLTVESSDIDAFSHGGWAACEVCHRLIESGKRDKLATRSAKLQYNRLLANNTLIPLENLIGHVRRLQDQFWENREGPPVPADSAMTKDPTR